MNSITQKIKNDQSGVILVTVLMLTIVMSVVVVGVMSVSVSQVSSGQRVKDSIISEQLALGAYYQYLSQQIEGVGNNLDGTNEQIGNKNFAITVTNNGDTPESPSNTAEVDVIITY